MELGSKPGRALRPDAQAFDEVRITTVPRYKRSGLSGDEWRISAKIELLRKGRVIVEEYAGTVQAATAMLPGLFLKAIDDGRAWFAGEGDFCDQEGCSEPATVTYRLRKSYCMEGHPSDPLSPLFRRFCQRHAKRGDCGLEDADANYESVEAAVTHQ